MSADDIREHRIKNISVLVESSNGRKYRVIDNMRELLRGQTDRSISETIVGRKVLDLARTLEVDNDPR